jgi:hypothetical protein
MKHEITNLDVNQITRYTFDEEHQATRVVITGAELGDIQVSMDTEKMETLLGDIKSGMEADRNKPLATTVPETKTVIQTIEVPVILKETEIVKIEQQVIVKEIEYREIEKPIIVMQTEIIKIEVPVIQKEVQIVEIFKNTDPKTQVIEIIKLILLAVIAIAMFLKH